MGCDDAYGPVGSTSDARKRLEEGRAELNRREAERWRAEANFGEREDEWREDFPEPEWHKAKSDEYVPSIPSTSEYIRSLCREKLELETQRDAVRNECDKFRLEVREQADEWAEVGSLPRTPPNRRGEQVYGNGRLDSYRSCAQRLHELLDRDVSH